MNSYTRNEHCYLPDILLFHYIFTTFHYATRNKYRIKLLFLNPLQSCHVSFDRTERNLKPESLENILNLFFVFLNKYFPKFFLKKLRTSTFHIVALKTEYTTSV